MIQVISIKSPMCMSYDHMIPALDICDYVISTFPHHLSLLLMLPGLSLCFLTFLEFTSLQPFLIFLLQVEQNVKCREWCLDIPFNYLACYVRCFHSHLKYVDVAIHKKMSWILELFIWHIVKSWYVKSLSILWSLFLHSAHI